MGGNDRLVRLSLPFNIGDPFPPLEGGIDGEISGELGGEGAGPLLS